jgi:hypothetical protein
VGDGLSRYYNEITRREDSGEPSNLAGNPQSAANERELPAIMQEEMILDYDLLTAPLTDSSTLTETKVRNPRSDKTFL